MNKNTADAFRPRSINAAQRSTLRRRVVGLLLTAAACLPACGGDEDDPNDPEAYCEGRILVLEYKGERIECPESCADDTERGVAQCVTAEHVACAESACDDDDSTALPCGPLGLLEARRKCVGDEVCAVGRGTAECVASARQPCGEGHVCTADGALATCGKSGFALAGATVCADPAVCLEWGYASTDTLLPEDAECVLEPLTECSGDVCLDANTLGTCGASKRVIAESPCGEATSCLAGRCVPVDRFPCGAEDCKLDQVCLAQSQGMSCSSTSEGGESCNDDYTYSCGECPAGTTCLEAGASCGPTRAPCGPGLSCVMTESGDRVCRAYRE